MRTIKFRGLRTDGKGWVYGGYFQHTPDEDGVRYYIFDFNEGAVEVIPESVGQFTGLHDKNGKEIYEGDLDQDGGRVFYNESIARFQIDYGGDIDIADMEDVGEWMIVSGNIYENKELLNS